MIKHTEKIKYYSYTYKIIYTSPDAKNIRKEESHVALGDVYILSLRR